LIGLILSGSGPATSFSYSPSFDGQSPAKSSITFLLEQSEARPFYVNELGIEFFLFIRQNES
jgi:hypothetical protein